MNVSVARVYDEVGKDSSPRVLVDRLWPRGLTRAEAPFTSWEMNLAPTPELRNWYGHAAGRFEEFGRRYRMELTAGTQLDALDALRQRAMSGDLVLLTATKDLGLSHAVVLREVLLGE